MTRDAAELTGERQSTHGDYADNARVSQAIKRIIYVENMMRMSRNQRPLSDTQKDALDMIATKIGRIMAGDPSVQDHWDDIAGYAHLANKKNGSQDKIEES